MYVYLYMYIYICIYRHTRIYSLILFLNYTIVLSHILTIAQTPSSPQPPLLHGWRQVTRRHRLPTGGDWAIFFTTAIVT